jgi:hypothetical protein
VEKGVISQKEYESLLAEVREMREALQKVALCAYPDIDTACSRYACPTCDMGDSGHSTKGQGFHDNECPIQLAHELLLRFPPREGGQGKEE